jgi:prepilin-type N-terminal cleavage/methylation domain-containing protein
MRPRPHRPRAGFTLLEVLISSAIGLVLLAALYVAVDIQVRLAQSAREVVEQSTLARALLARIGSDLSPSLAAPDPSRFRTSAGSGGAGGGGGAAAQPAAPAGAAATGAAAAATNTGAAAPAAAQPGAAASGLVTSNAGAFVFTVLGNPDMVSVFVSATPRVPGAGGLAPDAPAPLESDIRRITYWLAADGGLARRETVLATAEDATVPPQDLGDEREAILAEEVKELAFQYFDGTNWQDSWDGTALGADGQTPIGPPLLIAVTIAIPDYARFGRTADAENNLKRYRHVVSLVTANGPTQQTTDGTQATQP